MIRGAIFDVDGTLLDSMGIWKDVGVRYLNSIGIEAEPDLGNILFTMSIQEGAQYVKEHYHLSQEIEEIEQRLRIDFFAPAGHAIGAVRERQCVAIEAIA